MKHYDLDARYDLIEQARTIGATLDGQPAEITGARLAFAIVRPRQSTDQGIEYAWPTVAFVLAENGGRFRS